MGPTNWKLNLELIIQKGKGRRQFVLGIEMSKPPPASKGGHLEAAAATVSCSRDGAVPGLCLVSRGSCSDALTTLILWCDFGCGSLAAYMHVSLAIL